MSVQHAQRIPFRPGQCPECRHYASAIGRCRAYATESWPRPLLAVFEGESEALCPRFERREASQEVPVPLGSGPAPQPDTAPPAAERGFLSPVEPAAPDPEGAVLPVEPVPTPGASASATIACPTCGAQVEADSRFCRQCGARMGGVRGYCPACHAVRAASAEGTCSVCGAELFDRRAERRVAPVAATRAPGPEPAPSTRRGEARIYCPRCKTENPPTADRCRQCSANLLPAESAGTRIAYLIGGIAGAALLGFAAYKLADVGTAWQGPTICNPGVLLFAALFVLLSGFVTAARRTPPYVRYSERAQRHEKLNAWQALADLGRAIELAPKKERAGLLKRRVALYEKLGLQEEATRDLLARAADPDTFKGEAAFASMLTGADSGTYAQSRSAGALKGLLASGRARAVGYCARCRAAVELDAKLRCTTHRRTKGRNVQYVLPGEVEAGKKAALAAWEKERKGCRRWAVALILLLLAVAALVLIPGAAGILKNLPFLKTPVPTVPFQPGGIATFDESVFSFDYPAGWSRMGSKEIRSLKSGSLEGIGSYDIDYLGGVYSGGVNDCLGCAEIVAVVLAVDELTGTLSLEQYERIRDAEEAQMGSRLLLHELTNVGSLPAVESKFVGKSRASQQWQLLIVPKEPGKLYMFGCSSHKDSWGEFEAACQQTMRSLAVEGGGEGGIEPAVAEVEPATAPTAQPTPRPTTKPTAAPANGCPPNPAMVHIVNELGADLLLELTLSQTYSVRIAAGSARDVCLPAGEYAYSATAQGFAPETGATQFVAGVRRCWWWFKGGAAEQECAAPQDASAYTPP